MLSILSLGFLVGMQHALEADHVAAVSSIAARRDKVGDIVRHGLTWGLGHTAALFVFAGAAIILGQAIPQDISGRLEAMVGIMLVGLGAHVLWRLWRDRIHFHGHRHGDGTMHVHAHSHVDERIEHARAPHAHEHGFRWRALAVGLIHGMAGSAALLVLTVAQNPKPIQSLAYILVFGVGSMVGMAALSVVIAVPLTLSARFLTWANHALQATIGAVAIGVGARTLLASVIA